MALLWDFCIKRRRFSGAGCRSLECLGVSRQLVCIQEVIISGKGRPPRVGFLTLAPLSHRLHAGERRDTLKHAMLIQHYSQTMVPNRSSVNSTLSFGVNTWGIEFNSVLGHIWLHNVNPSFKDLNLTLKLSGIMCSQVLNYNAYFLLFNSALGPSDEE